MNYYRADFQIYKPFYLVRPASVLAKCISARGGGEEERGSGRRCSTQTKKRAKFCLAPSSSGLSGGRRSSVRLGAQSSGSREQI